MKKLIITILFALLSMQFAGAGEIHDAAKYGDVKTVDELADKNSNLLYAKDEQGKTPLHLATGWGQLKVMKLILDKYHIDVNIKNANGGTPLHVAASQAQAAAAKILIEQGAEINIRRDKDGATPLHVCVVKGSKPGHYQIAEMLLDDGANPNAKMYNGATPLSIAKSMNNVKMIEILTKPRKGLDF